MLHGRRIVLRKLEASDLDRTWEWINSPEIALAMGVHIPVSRTAQQRWFADADARRDKVIFAVCLAEDGRHVGNVELDSIDLRHRNARLSVFLADPSIRRAGLGTEAVSLVLEYAFEFLNLHRVHLKLDASREDELVPFYGRFGFVREGVMREHEFRGGAYIDKVSMGLLRREWRPLHRVPGSDAT